MFEEVYSFANLYDAYLKARKQKRYRAEVVKFSYALEENLIVLQNELVWKTYRIGRYRPFIVYEPKRRQIVALPFRDRVVQHALNNVIEPIFDRRMIYDSFACRKCKGNKNAARRLSYFMGKQDVHYYLKVDMKAYFQSINVTIIKSLIRRNIQDENVLWLLDQIYDSSPVPGMPIGNLMSQLSANVCLHELDHFLKNALGVKYYIRYMDDIIILSKSKDYLRGILEEIKSFVRTNLALELNHKTHIGKTAAGIEFVGYRIWKDYKLIKKQSLRRMKKKFRAWRSGKMTDEKYLASIGSWAGHTFDTASHRAVEKIMLDSLRQFYDRGIDTK